MSVEHLDPSDDARWIAGAIAGAAESLVERTLHDLRLPPHYEGGYPSSALCACGEWQWDADDPGQLMTAIGTISMEWVAHVRERVR